MHEQVKVDGPCVGDEPGAWQQHACHDGGVVCGWESGDAQQGVWHATRGDIVRPKVAVVDHVTWYSGRECAPGVMRKMPADLRS